MEIFIIIMLLAILAEATYLVARAAAKPSQRRLGLPVFVDTSVLIDGRIVAVAEAGFLTSELRVPRSVIAELQLLADQGDSEKRTRARHGLDVLYQLQQIDSVSLTIIQDGKALDGVDNQLLKLAKQYHGAVCTIDYNLNKVASVEGIPVLNLNELAKNLRIAYLPGEVMPLALTQKGQDSHQAVGYLGDGTMVVVEHANKLIGQTVEVEVIRSLQTAAGKMMFAKPIEKKAVTAPGQKAKGRRIVESKRTEQVSEPKQKNRTSAPRSNRRPKSREDSLLELVDKQR